MASFYPPAAIGENVGATCQVTFDVGAACEAVNVRVVCTAEKFVEEFENAASRQIELWTFPPDRIGETDVGIELDFEVED